MPQNITSQNSFFSLQKKGMLFTNPEKSPHQNHSSQKSHHKISNPKKVLRWKISNPQKFFALPVTIICVPGYPLGSSCTLI